MRALQAADIKLLTRMPGTGWTLNQFEKFFNTSGAIGWLLEGSWVLGEVINGELFIKKTRWDTADNRIELLKELNQQFDRVHIELSFEKSNHNQILVLDRLGFEAWMQPGMKIRMARGRKV